MDSFEAYLTHFGQYDIVEAGNGAFLRKAHVQSEYISKRKRIMLFQLVSGKQCQMNRVDGAEDAPYLTKVDALHILPFKDCQVMMLVPPHIDYRLLLTSENTLKVERVWVFEAYPQTTNSGTKVPMPVQPANRPSLPKGAKLNPQAQHAKPLDKRSVCSKDEAKTPTYTPPITAPPPTIDTNSIHPHQSNPYPDSAQGQQDADIPIDDQPGAAPGDKDTPGKLPGENQNIDALSCSDEKGHTPTVSPTLTWTHLPESQHLTDTNDLPAVAADSSNQQIAGYMHEEDAEMLASNLHPRYTPEGKCSQATGGQRSGQKVSPLHASCQIS